MVRGREGRQGEDILSSTAGEGLTEKAAFAQRLLRGSRSHTDAAGRGQQSTRAASAKALADAGGCRELRGEQGWRGVNG